MITAQGAPLADRVVLPVLIGGSRIHAGAFVALVAVAGTAWTMRTGLGYRIDLVGANPSLAAQAGIRPVRLRVAMLLTSAALAGLAGAVQLFGVSYRLSTGLTGGVGYTGVLIAVLGRGRPIATGVAAIVFAILITGGESLEREGVPRTLSAVIQAVLIVGVALALSGSRRRSQRVSELRLGRVLGGRAGRRAAPRPAGGRRRLGRAARRAQRHAQPRARRHMALGAFSGVVGSVTVGRTFGLLAGAACGALVGLLFAVLVLVRRADQVVVGFALSLGGVGLATFLYRTVYDSPPSIDPFGVWPVPGLGRIPLLGPVLFRQPVIVWLFPLSLVVMAWALDQTRAGLELRAAGDAPDAAAARGVDVTRVRLRTTVVASALGGLGGALLSAGIVGEFSDQIIGGRGFLALALVIAARRRPLWLLPAAWGVGALQAFQLRVQTVGGLGLPVELLRALPYLVTLAVLAFGRRQRSIAAGGVDRGTDRMTALDSDRRGLAPGGVGRTR